MKHQHLTWYLLVDGTQADPDDVAPGDDGVLRHKNGLAVALHESGAPMTIGRGAIENKNVEAAQAGADAAVDATALKAEEAAEPVKTDDVPVDEAKVVRPVKPKAGYKTRESKAR